MVRRTNANRTCNAAGFGSLLVALACSPAATNEGRSNPTAGGANSTAAGSGGAVGGEVGNAGQTTTSGGGGSGGTSTSLAGTAGAPAPQGGSGGTGGSSGAASGGSGGASGGNAGGTSGSGGAMSPANLPSGYTLLFEETFAQPAAMDRFLFGNPGDWAHVPTDGGYAEWTGFSYAPPFRSPMSVAIVKDAKFGSLVLEVEVMQTSMTGGHRDFCVFWNMVSPSEFYYAHIGQAHDGVSHNIHIVNNADRTAITQVFDTGFDWGVDEWRTIRLVRDTATGLMEIYGGDATVPMLTATDTTFTDGYVGVGAFDDTGRVRNLRVWAETSTPLLANFFQPLQ